jgi:hypothetical protein
MPSAGISLRPIICAVYPRSRRAPAPICERGRPMKRPRRKFLRLAAGAAALPTISRIGWTQAYPSRPVRLLTGFAAAGGSDVVARLIGQWLSERLGQSFIIENRPGAGGNIGTESVVRAPPDGYTLLLVTFANVVNASLYKKSTSTSSATSHPLPALSACRTSWPSTRRCLSGRCPSSSNMPRLMRARSPWHLPETEAQAISPVNCSR